MHFITIDVIRKQYQSLDPCILNNKQNSTIQLNTKNQLGTKTTKQNIKASASAVLKMP